MFQLDNVLNDNYTGIFSTLLSATFYKATSDSPAARTADVILPLTTRSNDSSQMLVYPGKASVRTALPINAAEAWLEVLATGAADEVSACASRGVAVVLTRPHCALTGVLVRKHPRSLE